MFYPFFYLRPDICILKNSAFVLFRIKNSVFLSENVLKMCFLYFFVLKNVLFVPNGARTDLQ